MNPAVRRILRILIPITQDAVELYSMIAKQSFDRAAWKQPPWLAFPEVTPDMYPRLQAWNAYCNEWTQWYLSLQRNERNAYEDAHPEPPRWESFYRFVSNERR